MPQSILKIFVVIFLGVYSFSLFTYPVYSDDTLGDSIQSEIDQKNQELADKQSTLSVIEARIAEISGSNYSVSQKIALINTEITDLETQISETEGSLNSKIAEIEEKQRQVAEKKDAMDELSGELYMQSRSRFLTFVLSKDGWDDFVESLLVKKNMISVLKDEVEAINGEFTSLEESRAQLEAEKVALETQKKDLDDAYALLATEKAKLQKELNSQYAQKATLTAQIGGIQKELSDLQDFLLTVKSGGTVIDAGGLISSSSNGSLAYFDSNAPSGSFAVFSFGAFTHRDGMSQWGAKARDDAGQSYQDILAAYYPGKVITTGHLKTSNYGEEAITDTIIVDGREVDLEDVYMLGIREIDGRWNTSGDLNVLKAQAIASRTYAVNYTSNGRNNICSTTSCQVFDRNNPYPSSSAWAQAVRETAGMVLTNSSGYIFSSKFSAVTGGWINGLDGGAGWYDVRSWLGQTEWYKESWENISGVTWFYRTWFDYNTASGSYGACSTHPNPWLTGEEMADLLNAYKYWVQEGSPSTDPRLTAVDTRTCWCAYDSDACNANPYSMAELRNLVDNPVIGVSGVFVTNSNGNTTAITFVTNAGNISFSGDGINSFRKIYMLRSPGYLMIPQSGFTHINIEKS